MTAVLDYLDTLFHFYASSTRESKCFIIGLTSLFLKITLLFLILLAIYYSQTYSGIFCLSLLSFGRGEMVINDGLAKLGEHNWWIQSQAWFTVIVVIPKHGTSKFELQMEITVDSVLKLHDHIFTSFSDTNASALQLL